MWRPSPATRAVGALVEDLPGREPDGIDIVHLDRVVVEARHRRGREQQVVVVVGAPQEVGDASAHHVGDLEAEPVDVERTARLDVRRAEDDMAHAPRSVRCIAETCRRAPIDPTDRTGPVHRAAAGRDQRCDLVRPARHDVDRDRVVEQRVIDLQTTVGERGRDAERREPALDVAQVALGVARQPQVGDVSEGPLLDAQLRRPFVGAEHAITSVDQAPLGPEPDQRIGIGDSKLQVDEVVQGHASPYDGI